MQSNLNMNNKGTSALIQTGQFGGNYLEKMESKFYYWMQFLRSNFYANCASDGPVRSLCVHRPEDKLKNVFGIRGPVAGKQAI